MTITDPGVVQKRLGRSLRFLLLVALAVASSDALAASPARPRHSDDSPFVGDAFEPDGTSAQASLLTLSVTQSHTFDVNGDVDWARFSVVSGQQYTVSTSNLATFVDTVIFLYGSDATTQLATDDDGGGGRSSRIIYTATTTGTYFVKVVQFNGTGIGAYDLTAVNSTPPGAFGKVSPLDGATSQPASLTLTWGASSGATSYEYCVYTFSCSTWTSVGTALSANVSGLVASTTYLWQVRANGANGSTYANGSISAGWTFTTMAPPGNFGKISPAHYASLQPTSVTLSWGASSGASSYEYCYDATYDSACSGWTSAGTSTSVALSGLATCTTFDWQIRATNAGGGATYADGYSISFWRFSTICPPGPFGKTSPVNGATSVPTTATLTWGTASSAAGYEYCYDTTNDNACTTWVLPTSATSTTLTGLSAGTSYFWHVRANGVGATTYANGSSTAFWTFTTGPGAFSKSAPSNGSTGVSTSPTLSWGAAATATSYEYCYDTTQDGACSSWTSTGTSTSAVLSGLSTNIPYSWQVRAIGPTGTTYADGSSSTFWPFTTGSLGLAGAVQALAVDPTNAQVVYAGTTLGVYKSVNGGASWTRADHGLTYTDVRALAIKPEAPCTVFAGIDTHVSNSGGWPAYFINNSTGVLAVSSDCGATWGIAPLGPSGRRTESLAFSSARPSVLYGAVIVNDGSCNGTPPFVTCQEYQKGTVARLLQNSGESSYFTSFLATNVVATDPVSPCTTYYAISEFSSGQVYRNLSCSVWSWTAVGAALSGAVKALVVHPTNPATLFAGTSAGVIYRKIDSTSPWTSVATVSGAVNSIVFDPSNASVAYAATGGGVVYKTIDGGGTWSPTSSIGFALSSLAVSPTVATSVYVGGNPFVINLGSVVLPPTTTLTATPAVLSFAATKNGAAGALVSVTPAQNSTVGFTGAVPTWTATSNQPWLQVTGGTGTGAGSWTAAIVNPGNVIAGQTVLTATITVSAPTAVALQIPVTLTVTQTTSTTLPAFGQVDTPAQNAVNQVGAIGVTGWAMDDLGVQSVKVYRTCLSFDNPASCQVILGHSVVLIGDAAFLAGARPDVEAAFPTYPFNYRAGWGMQILTNMLPHIPTQRANGGQGTLELFAFATDVEGHVTLLGRTSTDTTPTSITMNNDAIAKPFGTADTPIPGSTVSGTIPAFLWALTPDVDAIANGNDILIPTNGSTMFLFIDGVAVGPVAYNQCRGTVGNPPGPGVFCNDDVANIFGTPTPQAPLTPRGANPTRFRNLDAARGAIGVNDINTTLLSNGLHTIAWSVTDSAGRVEGIGSRFFLVLNSNGSLTARIVALLVADAAPAMSRGPAASLASLPVSRRPVSYRTGFDATTPVVDLPVDAAGVRHVALPAGGRVEINLAGKATQGYLDVNGELRDLPVGSHLDLATGVFTWTPAVTYVGAYRLVFLINNERLLVEVSIDKR